MPDTTSPTEAAPVAGVDTPPRGSRAVRITAVVALVGVVAALIGIGLLARPLSTPTQDCGTAASFLIGGKPNEFIDPADRPTGVTRAEAEANNANPCQERAANRAWPAGALVVGATLVSLGALVTEAAIRFRLRRAARRA